MSGVTYLVFFVTLLSYIYLGTSESPVVLVNDSSITKECPFDSFRNDSGFCTCYMCESMEECKSDEIPRIVREGVGTPGMCCPLYVCSQVQTHPDEEYVHENVNKSCTQSGKFYRHDEKWREDRCTECICRNGEPKCIASLCFHNTMVVRKPCASIANSCDLKCTYGFRLKNDGCELCECRLPPSVYEIIEGKNITSDEMYRILKIIKETNLMIDATARTKSENGDIVNCYSGNALMITLVSIVFILVASCGLLLWLLRECKLKNNRMEVCRTQGSNHQYTNVPSYDSNLNATYKCKTDIVK